MASPIGLVNQALTRLGEERLASVQDTSIRAQNVRDVYDKTRRSLLRAYPWDFAVKRAILGPDGSTPAFRWKYRLPLPAATDGDGGWVRNESVWQDADETRKAAYKLEGRAFLADVDTLYLVYVADITDLDHWDELTIDVLGLALAARLAITLTSSSQVKAETMADYKAAFAEAAAVDSQDDFPVSIPASDWEMARFAPFGGGLSADDIALS